MRSLQSARSALNVPHLNQALDQEKRNFEAVKVSGSREHRSTTEEQESAQTVLHKPEHSLDKVKSSESVDSQPLSKIQHEENGGVGKGVGKQLSKVGAARARLTSRGNQSTISHPQPRNRHTYSPNNAAAAECRQQAGGAALLSGDSSSNGGRTFDQSADDVSNLESAEPKFALSPDCVPQEHDAENSMDAAQARANRSSHKAQTINLHFQDESTHERLRSAESADSMQRSSCVEARMLGEWLPKFEAAVIKAEFSVRASVTGKLRTCSALRVCKPPCLARSLPSACPACSLYVLKNTRARTWQPAACR